VRAPPKPKPNTALETDRVMRIFDALWDELEKKLDPGPGNAGLEAGDVLAVAERIAARTED
jgi:hypothetical protein